MTTSHRYVQAVLDKLPENRTPEDIQKLVPLVSQVRVLVRVWCSTRTRNATGCAACLATRPVAAAPAPYPPQPTPTHPSHPPSTR